MTHIQLRRLYRRGPAHIEIENGMAQRQVGDLDESIFTRAHVEIQIAGAAQLVVSSKSGKRDHPDFCSPCPLDRREDIGRLPGAADRDQEIARASMKLQ